MMGDLEDVRFQGIGSERHLQELGDRRGLLDKLGKVQQDLAPGERLRIRPE